MLKELAAVEAYLADLRDIHSRGVGTKETSYYAPLVNLLNEVGKTLKPKIHCIMHPASRGAGIPDIGLFGPKKASRDEEAEFLQGEIPEHGVIEVKSTSEEVGLTADSEQVSRYWNRYQQVLVTNYRDFLLVGEDTSGRPTKLEPFRLAESADAFWKEAVHPRRMAEEHGERLVEYLKRVMLHSATLAYPKDVAWFLASYARDGKARIENSDVPALVSLREALEEALGLKFTGEKGDHFFRSTLVQTLFYGMFSAWVIWSKDQSPQDHEARFDWKNAAWTLRVPMIRSLFEQVATPSKLGQLGLVEVLDWACDTLNRVDRAAFFEKFEDEHAVQYFYEPFLEAFDPELRKDLGVWYTPREVVQYMVARVDTVLREELDIEDGLADPNVYVLDPCCGTGAYLVEVLHKIADTLKAKGGDDLLAHDLKTAAMNRVFGFEILPAPFVISHLQLGLALHKHGAPLSETEKERAGVYLTNALTGWEPPEGVVKERLRQLSLSYPELAQERDAAFEVKQERPILVILGNPPYNAFAGVSPDEEMGLIDAFKDGLADWGITKNYLDDLYVRFVRLAERCIVDSAPNFGVICLISNSSYLSDASYVVMRQRFVAEFDALWFDCLNGDSRETGKLTPDGKPDPSVFSTEQNRAGIRVGTAIGLFVRRREREGPPTVLFRHLWGATKRADLLRSLHDKDHQRAYVPAKPLKENRYSFRPTKCDPSYDAWPSITDVALVSPMLGLNENRGGALQDIDREKLASRMKAYLSPDVSWSEFASMGSGLARPAAGFEPRVVRVKVTKAEPFSDTRIVEYARRPFDSVWAYISDVSPVWNRSRPDLRAHTREERRCVLCRPSAAATPEGVPFFYSTLIGEQDSLRGHAYYFPMRLGAEKVSGTKVHTAQLCAIDSSGPQANLSSRARDYLTSLGLRVTDGDEEAARISWMHVLATGYSPAYLRENADGIKDNWPRIPLPGSKKLLLDSSELGRQVARFLDTEDDAAGVTKGDLRSELKALGSITRIGGGSLNPDKGDLEVTTGWGHSGKDNVTMPGRGKYEERDYTTDELAAIKAGAKTLGLTMEQALGNLGNMTYDIFLNGTACWKNVPSGVWNYYIGGYQVVKKWLSYRESKLLGRDLKPEEARYVTEMVRRIAAILLLQPALDNYRAVKEHAYGWPK